MTPSIAIELLRENAAQVADRLRALANSDRLIMLCRLSDGEASVNELVAITGMPQSSVSQHLATLREAGVITARAEGQRRFYSISDPQARRIMAALCQACTPEGEERAAEPICG